MVKRVNLPARLRIGGHGSVPMVGEEHIILGVDFGGKCGVAIILGQELAYHDTLELGKRTPKSLLLFQNSIYDLIIKYDVGLVSYEVVRQGHRSRSAACAYGSYEGILWVVCESLDIRVVGVNVQRIKNLVREVTQKSNPGKDESELAVYTLYGCVCYDDNSADAVLVAECARIDES